MPYGSSVAEPDRNRMSWARLSRSPSRSCVIWIWPEATSFSRSFTSPSYSPERFESSATFASCSWRLEVSSARVFSSFATSPESCSLFSRRSSISSISLSRSPPSASFERSRSATRVRSFSSSSTARSYLPRVTHPEAAAAANTSATSPLVARLQRVFERFIDGPHVLEVEPLEQPRLDLLDVLSVARRQDYTPDSSPLRREHLLLDPAHGKHAPAQRDLA